MFRGLGVWVNGFGKELGASHNEGCHFEGSHNKGYNILGYILGFLLFTTGVQGLVLVVGHGLQ